MKIELPVDNGVVISLEAVRESRGMRRYSGLCMHNHVQFDTSVNEVHCKDCKKELNPVEYLALLVEHWIHVKYLTEQYNRAKLACEAVTKCKCQHCGKMTSVPKARGKLKAVSTP